MIDFDPSEVGVKGKIFGFPYTEEVADLILLPIPWDVTVSYKDGTANAPEGIVEESSQLDFVLPHIKNGHTYPVAMLEVNQKWKGESKKNREVAKRIIQKLESDQEFETQDLVDLTNVNRYSHALNQEVEKEALNYLKEGKVVGAVGGDHSTPLGLIKALGAMNSEFGILQIDAHMDLRDAYEGFEYSHASIMTNALQVPSVSKLVQVGIRDYCQEEVEAVEVAKGKVSVHFDEPLRRKIWEGSNWSVLAKGIVEELPQNVYISFDMDGLEPSLCPSTGTPVPGGLSFYEASTLIEEVVRSGRKIIGFDLSETGDAQWDANVASRILYRLVTATGVSRGHLTYS